MISVDKKVKTFTTSVTRIPGDDGAFKVLPSEQKPLDQQVNEWLGETGNVLVSLFPWSEAKMEGGAHVSYTHYVITYMSAVDWVKLEQYLRGYMVLSKEQGDGQQEIPTVSKR